MANWGRFEQRIVPDEGECTSRNECRGFRNDLYLEGLGTFA